jgi:hypothetical protein
MESSSGSARSLLLLEIAGDAFFKIFIVNFYMYIQKYNNAGPSQSDEYICTVSADER